MGNAERMAVLYGDEIRYCHSLGKWFIWNDSYWQLDDHEGIYGRAKRTIRQIHGEAGAYSDEAVRKSILRHAFDSEGVFRINALIKLAQSEHNIPISSEQLDKDDWLLNVVNGTLNLRTGQLQPHDRHNYITRIAPTGFNPNAECPRWEAFLYRSFDGDTALIHYVQKAIGYALTGDTSEQSLFFMHGDGDNGKSTFVNTISDMLGTGYAKHTDPSTLLIKSKTAIRNDLARLKGVRYVSAVETSADKQFDETMVKQMTGQDTITARFLHQEYFEFKPCWKIFLAANYKPKIVHTDWAIWRRIKPIPFEVKIEAQEKDGHLDDRLRAELSGILNWALAGCLAWQKEGMLPMPTVISNALTAYREEMDPLNEFMHDCCYMHDEARVMMGDLFTCYSTYCKSNHEKPMGKKEFGKEVRSRKFKSARAGAGWFWRGIGLAHIVSLTSFTDEGE